MSEVEKVGAHEGFKAIVKNNDKVAVMFTASWCGPCNQIKPTFTGKCPGQYPKIKFIMVDVDENEETSMEYDVESMPTFMFFRDGNLVNELTFKGADVAQLEANLPKL